MDISVFEIIGPVMLGPSSSCTAGMARLGNAAYNFLTEPLASIDLKFHPENDTYFGLRSHLALIGGAMGIPEYDTRLANALDIAREKDIKITTSTFIPPLPKSILTVQLSMVQISGKRCSITGVSVGGGSIDIIKVDDFKVKLNSTSKYIFIWSSRNILKKLSLVLDNCDVYFDKQDNDYLFYFKVCNHNSKSLKNKIKAISDIKKVLLVEPFLSYGYVNSKPLFTTYRQLIDISNNEDKSICELAVNYEVRRSGNEESKILKRMKMNLQYMKETVEVGLKEEIQTLYRFGTGIDGKKLMDALRKGNTLSGSTLNRAVAKAIATMEVDCSMGRVVAAPTAGSCGIIPGCFLTVQEDKNLEDDEIVKALFVAAAVGIVMYYNNVSFSGASGGCQGEIGVSSAMAAAGLTYLGGGNADQIVNASTLALKNILGLICDNIGGSSEIPCIKRNGIGVSNAFSCADLALAGIQSYIPPDEVIGALVNCQRILPPELRGGCGGLASTNTAKIAKKIENQINSSIMI